MPDGDNVRKKLERKYHQPYKRICAGKDEDDEIVFGLIRSTVEQIKHYGDEAIQLLAEIAHLCQDMQIGMPLFYHQVNWSQAWQKIEKIAQETYMDKRAKNLVLLACKEQFEIIHQGGIVHHLHIEMLSDYFWKVYRADFEAFVASGEDHMHNAKPEIVNATLARIRPQVREKLLPHVKYAYYHETITTLRQPSHYPGKKKKLSIDSNLLAM